MSRRRPSRWTVDRVRSMARHEGLSPDVIARTVGIPRAEVMRILDRSITHKLASSVRTMHAAGDPAEAIAAALALPLDRVADYIVRIITRGRRKHRARPKGVPSPGPTAGRSARSPRPRALTRSEWSPLRGPEYRDESPPPATIAAAELPRAGDLGDGQGDGRGPRRLDHPPSTIAETWGSVHADPRPGGRNGNAALSDADATRAREMRARGVPRGDVARELGVSAATITRITRGDTYRDASRALDQSVGKGPATSPGKAGEGPWPGVWEG